MYSRSVTSLTRHLGRSLRTPSSSIQARSFASKMDSSTISKITDAEREITGLKQPVPSGPTAEAQKHANEPITSEVLHDITVGEKKVTGGERLKGGPTSVAQSELGKAINSGEVVPPSRRTQNTAQTTTSSSNLTGNANNTNPNDPVLDSANISRIHEAETKVSSRGDANSPPIADGPTAAAQSHAGEPINSQTLHDITEGEKRVTGEDHAVKGGPTSVAQSVLGKSRAERGAN